MMNLEKYIAQYMKKEFSESSFQIWNYDAAVGNAQLLKDRGREKAILFQNVILISVAIT